MENFSWSDLLGGGIGSAVGGLFNWLEGDNNRKHQAEMQKNQNDWQSDENELNRKFQSEEAMKAREWQEDFYEQYQSPEAQIASQMAGYKANGINPALMFGGSAPSGGSVPSTSAPGGSSGSPGMVHSPQMDLGNMVQDFAAGVQITEQLFTAKDRFNVIKHEAEIKRIQSLYDLLDYEDRDFLKKDIREMKQFDYVIKKDQADQSLISTLKGWQDLDLGKEELERSKMDTELKREEFNTLLSKNKKGDTLLATNLKADVLNKIRDADLKLDDHQMNEILKGIKEVEAQIVDENLSQEKAKTVIDNFYKDYVEQHGIKIDSDPFNILMQKLMPVSNQNNLQDASQHTFVKNCDNVDPETGMDGWQVLLLIATTMIPYGRIAKVGGRIFGKLFPQIFKSFSSVRGTPQAKKLQQYVTSSKKVREGVDKRGNPYRVTESERYSKPLDN